MLGFWDSVKSIQLGRTKDHQAVASSAGALFLCLVLTATAGLCSGVPCLGGPHGCVTALLTLHPSAVPPAAKLLEKLWWDSVSSCALQRSRGGAGARGPGGKGQSQARHELRTSAESWCPTDLVVGAGCRRGTSSAGVGSRWLCRLRAVDARPRSNLLGFIQPGNKSPPSTAS